MARSNGEPAPMAAPTDGEFRPGKAYATLAFLLVLYTLSFLDRSILSLLVGPLKAELGLDDVQVSLLIGAAFSVFYALMGLPLAYVADRWRRTTLISIGVTFWSIMTAMGGLAPSFGLLLLSRLGVGLGEAALSPAAYSLIADIFPRQRTGQAMAIYTIGAPLGTGLAMCLGGTLVTLVTHAGAVTLPLLGETSAWRVVLLCVGLPGVLPGLLFLLIREPAHKKVAAVDVGADQPLFAFLWTHAAALLPLIIGMGLVSAIVYGSLMWAPTMFERTYRIAAADAAVPIGAAIGASGVLGMISGGVWGDRLLRRGVPDAYVQVLRWSAVGALPFFALMPLMPNWWLSLGCLFFASYFQTLQAGLPAGSLQLVTPVHLRARMVAVYLMSTSLIGLGLGPTVIALGSRYFFGEPHLDHSMALAAVLILSAAIACLSMALRPYRALLARRGAAAGTSKPPSPNTDQRGP